MKLSSSVARRKSMRAVFPRAHAKGVWRLAVRRKRAKGSSSVAASLQTNRSTRARA